MSRLNKHIVFDLDGVLCDCDELHRVALNKALSVCGPQAPLTMDEHLTIFKGLPTRVKLARLADVGRIPADWIPKVNALKQEATIEEIRKLRPDPVKIELLTMLQAVGWEIAVCSNAVRRSVFEMLLASGLIDFLAFYLSNEDAPPKPDPGMYTKAARLLGVPPDEVVVVEDSAPGRESALRAGCRLVAVDGPEEVGPELLSQIKAALAKEGGNYDAETVMEDLASGMVDKVSSPPAIL